MSSLQNSLAIVGGVTLVCVVLYNLWTARQNAPRQAAPEPSSGVDPVLDHSDLGRSGFQDSAYLDDEIDILPTPEKKPPLDALIDVIA
ncbi:MAG: cell division protein FtsZ, partial [Betaproteobacteria bacterium]|nr:cell division protein FtsZ [Betaproteobacteria bacterium]